MESRNKIPLLFRCSSPSIRIGVNISLKNINKMLSLIRTNFLSVSFIYLMWFRLQLASKTEIMDFRSLAELMLMLSSIFSKNASAICCNFLTLFSFNGLSSLAGLSTKTSWKNNLYRLILIMIFIFMSHDMPKSQWTRSYWSSHFVLVLTASAHIVFISSQLNLIAFSIFNYTTFVYCFVVLKAIYTKANRNDSCSNE